MVLAMTQAFPDAEIYTSLYNPGTTYPEFQHRTIHVSSLNRIPKFRRNHRLALPFLPATFSRLSVSADVVIASTSGWSHGARVDGKKLAYCYNPARWLYQPDEYTTGLHPSIKWGLKAARPSLLAWDRRAAATVDEYNAISSVVQQRIFDNYGISAQLFPPPHAADVEAEATAIAGIRFPFYLVVSRLMPYKNVTVVVDAFRSMGDSKLVIVGEGPLESSIRASAPSNVTMLKGVSDPELRWLYKNCSALVSSSFEDFGLTPLEANAFGKPAVLLRAGGFLDTSIHGETCIFFDQPDASDIADAVRLAEQMRWDESRLLENASRYSVDAFVARLRSQVMSINSA